MDFSPLVHQVFSTLWWLPLAVILISIIKSPWFKGIVGEFWINLSSRFILDKHIYRLVKNVTLPTADGTTQIDHVIVCIYGVFVIETKNMKGWIFGSARQATWTQKIYKYTTTFQNPLRQNVGHVKALQSLLGLDDSQIFSVIAFVGNSTFKTPMPANVTEGGGYARYIRSKTEKVLTPSQVEEILHTIQSARLDASFATQRAHVQHVREKIKNKDVTVFCPECDQSMVIRQSKKGPHKGKRFWGCSQFPRCRETKPLNEAS